MPVIHFLNVNDGDCSIIHHASNRITVIDVCNASAPTVLSASWEELKKSAALMEKGVNGNFGQKKYPVNPILYMQEHGYQSVFRFILTHPDMDHMDGIKAFFEHFVPQNFWDSDNEETKDFGKGQNGGYNEEDWNFYRSLRDGKPDANPKRLTLFSDFKGQYYNVNEDNQPGADGLHILAPTGALVLQANESGDFNDCSYVILYKTGKHRILFAGDSHDATWDHILATHGDSVKDIDLLIAPHHGRHSGRDWEFLDVLNPALTLFGNAASEHLAYAPWNNRGLNFITNNQAGSVIINAGTDPMEVFVTCKNFAEACIGEFSYYSDIFKGYYLGQVRREASAAA